MTPICLRCRLQLVRSNTGVTFEMMDGPDPWKKIDGDVLRCPACGYEIAAGFARDPVAEAGQARYEGTVAGGGRVWQTVADKQRAAYAEAVA